MADATIPGTEAVVNKVKGWAKVNTQEFNDVKGSLQRASEQAGASHQQLTKTINGLSAAWQGKDAESYRGYMQTFAAASKEAHELLNEGVKSIEKAVKDLDDAKGEMQSAINAMQTSYQQKLRNIHNPDGTAPNPGQQQGAGQQAAQEVMPQIDAAVKKAQGAMQTLSSQLSTQTASMSKTYNSVPTPDGSSGGAALSSNPVSYNGGGGGNYSGGGGGGGGGGLGSSGGPPSSPPPGNVSQWIDQAIALLKANGINVGPNDKQLIWEIIQHESGGNPNAINNWDSNAAAGHPSKGLMQCIDSTFQGNKLPGHDNIYNPVDNICAGVKYAIGRYGSLSSVPGVKAVAGGGGYVGY